ncbi:uncharacterized protein A4U43_C02F10590 [Asparagus officinalis]|uniref:Glycosyltransferase subfamily 4-like N-terminal domain-containing protein n=1 Tax=Asparagus officinalis TaxID=4686 RepID=A0A5P1FHC6_ASPOF|nr:uncharacterized protein LOC109830974 [Asparagus officinalis]ONK77785.1 uncharacterized protein A4U43_C02F10590 [Asparagus officinalis]
MRSSGPYSRTKRANLPSLSRILTCLLLPLLTISPGALLYLLSQPSTSNTSRSFSGDLRDAEFSWNSLPLPFDKPAPTSLRIAVFSRKWPVLSAPGGMERHALTLHSFLSRRGHRIHVFTAAAPVSEKYDISSEYLKIHALKGRPNQWQCEEAWELYEAENRIEPFDVVHSESVAMHHRFASRVPNLAVSWHGIASEALQSGIYQDLIRSPDMDPALNRSLSMAVFKVINEIRFFKNYEHHIATSDSVGEILRDIYQVPERRVHVILNGVDEEKFGLDDELGNGFRSEIGIPEDAKIVMGIAGRLVRDKGHPLVYAAFKKLITTHSNVYLIIAGRGPWEQRYNGLGPNVITLGALPPSRLKAFYNAIDIFVHPTLRPQGLDQTLIESMLCGTPIMATRLPSIKGSLLVNKEFGFMFPPNVEALGAVMEAAVAEGRRRLEERGRKCREYARGRLTATKMAMAHERLFLCIKNESYCMYPLGFD